MQRGNSGDTRTLQELYELGFDATGQTIHKIACCVCGAVAFKRYKHASYCDESCRKSAEVQTRSARRKVANRRRCAQRGDPFTGARSDAKFCGSPCRQAHYRTTTALRMTGAEMNTAPRIRNNPGAKRRKRLTKGGRRR